MPLYEYQCRKCGRKTEKIMKFSDPPLTVCEHCGGELEQLLSSPAIQFKGSGWYVTDYAKKGPAPGNGSGTDSAPAGETKGKEASTEKGSEKAKDSSSATEAAKTNSSKETSTSKSGKE